MTSINPQPESYIPPIKPFKDETLQNWLRRKRIAKFRKLFTHPLSLIEDKIYPPIATV